MYFIQTTQRKKKKMELCFTFILIVLQPAAPDEEVEESTGLFDGSSEMFLVAMAVLLAFLAVAVIAGLAFHFFIFVPGRKKGKRTVKELKR